MLFDLMRHCPLLRLQVESGRVAFGINHEIVDFKQNRKKYFDLVLCTPRTAGPSSTTVPFKDLADEYEIVLTKEQMADLGALPVLHRAPVGSVHVAFEAKACMTEHGKARPRLYDELNSSHLTIHGSSDVAIAAAFVLINAGVEFISPDRNKKKLGRSKPVVSIHQQPKVTQRVIDKIHEIPRRSGLGGTGFDALGIVVIDMKNDGSKARIVEAPPAPQPGDISHYESMIRRAAQTYEARFASV